MIFKIAKHSVTGNDLVEVYDGDRFLATIVSAPEGIKVVSKYATGQTLLDETSMPQRAVDGRRIRGVTVFLNGP